MHVIYMCMHAFDDELLCLQCDRTESLSQYFETVYPPNPTVLGLLGCGCSVASTPVAEIVSYNSISQVSGCNQIPAYIYTALMIVWSPYKVSQCVNREVHIMTGNRFIEQAFPVLLN